MSDAFANGARQSVITPSAYAGFFVRSDIGSDQPRQHLIGPYMSRAFATGNWRRAGLRPVGVGVTTEAAEHSIDQVLASGQTLRSRFKFPVSQSALLRANDRTPTYGEGDSQSNESDNCQGDDACKLLPATCHPFVIGWEQ